VIAPTPSSGAGRLATVSRLRPEVVLVGLLALAAFGLRASQLHQSLFGDEVLAYREIAGHSLGQTIRAVSHGVESSPPLFFVLAWLSAKLGDPTIWIRLPTLLLGTATVPVIYLLGRETIGRSGALIAAAIAAASPFALYYGVEARPYAAAEFFVALSTLALLRATRSHRRGDWTLYAMAAAGAAYSHYTTIFVLVTQFVWAAWVCRARMAPLLVATATAVVLYLPWLPSVHGSELGIYAALEPLSASHVLLDSLHPVVGYPYASLRAIPTTAGLASIAAVALLGLIWFVRDRRLVARLVRGEAGRRMLLVVLLALATPVGLLLYSLFVTDLWSSRSLIASVPAETVVLACLLAAIPWRLRIPALVVVLGLLVFGSVRAISPRYARPAYRVVAHYLDRVAPPADPVLMYSLPLVLDNALPAQLTRPHDLIGRVPRRWPKRPAGTLAFVVVDDAVLHVLQAPALAPAGYELIRRRHYPGLVPFSLLTYRAL
jgi:uncharacterized membrane protein